MGHFCTQWRLYTLLSFSKLGSADKLHALGIASMALLSLFTRLSLFYLPLAKKSTGMCSLLFRMPTTKPINQVGTLLSTVNHKHSKISSNEIHVIRNLRELTESHYAEHSKLDIIRRNRDSMFENFSLLPCKKHNYAIERRYLQLTKLNEGFKGKRTYLLSLISLQQCSIKPGSTILYKAQCLALRFTASADFLSCSQQRNKNKIRF